MKILFNPPIPLGSVIKGFKLEGYEEVEHNANEIAQYPDDLADALLDTFGFLNLVSPAEAKNILDNKGKLIKCDFPNCDFSTDYPVALAGHKSKHKKEAESITPVVDPNLIPVKGVKESGEKIAKKRDLDAKIDSGLDKDGVEWYGEGLTIDKNMAGPNVGDPGVFGG